MTMKRPTVLFVPLLVLLGGDLPGCGGGGGDGDADTDGGGDGGGDADGAGDAGDDVRGSCRPEAADRRDGDGPRRLLDDPVFADRPAHLGYDPGSVTHESLTVGSHEVHLYRFEVTSFDLRFGRAWTHPVVIVAPAPAALAHTDAAASSAGTGTLNGVAAGDEDPTWGRDHPPWFRGTDALEPYLESYGSIAVTQRIPMVFTNVVPPSIELDPSLVEEIQRLLPPDTEVCTTDCSGPQEGDEEVMDCLNRAALATGDLTHDAALNFAVAHMRVLDAAEQVLEEGYADLGTPIDLAWTRIWTIGSSKRGNTQRLLAALDPRIRGVVVAAADISNFVANFALQDAVWDGFYAFGGPAEGAILSEPSSDPWLLAFDTFRWRPEVLGDVDYVLAVGTNDHLYPLASSLLYGEALPEGHHMLLVPNYGHGHGAVDHVAAFRALVGHGLDGTAWPRVEATWDLESDVVTARVVGGDVAVVDLWCATGLGERNPLMWELVPPDCLERTYPEVVDSSDLRHASWERVSMERRGDGSYFASPIAGSLSYPACFVRVLTDDDRPATSGPLLSAPLCRASGLSTR